MTTRTDVVRWARGLDEVVEHIGGRFERTEGQLKPQAQLGADAAEVAHEAPHVVQDAA